MALGTGFARMGKELARRLGYSVRRLPDAGDLAGLLTELLPRLGVDLVFDVGAHHGEFAGLLRNKCRFSGDILSFEPQDSSRKELLLRSQSDERWQVKEFALSDRKGSAELKVASSDLFSSIEHLDDDRSAELSVRVSRTENVMLQRFDSFVVDSGLKGRLSRALLKIDTQGHDRLVIEGAGSMLSAIPVLVTELAAVPVYSGVPLLDETISELRERGFDLVRIYPVAHAKDGIRPLEFDGVFVNRGLLTN